MSRRPTELALRQAKINVIRNYLVVGVTEELEDFLFVLEKLLPEFFSGVLNIYRTPGQCVSKKKVKKEKHAGRFSITVLSNSLRHVC